MFPDRTPAQANVVADVDDVDAEMTAGRRSGVTREPRGRRQSTVDSQGGSHESPGCRGRAADSRLWT